jgi:hypothetical protein
MDMALQAPCRAEVALDTLIFTVSGVENARLPIGKMDSTHFAFYSDETVSDAFRCGLVATNAGFTTARFSKLQRGLDANLKKGPWVWRP